MAAAKMPMMPPAASVFGKGGSEPPEPESEVPEDFEAFAVEAFPDLEGDMVRLRALKDAINACMRAKNASAYEDEE